MGSCCKEEEKEKPNANGDVENQERLIGSFEDEPTKVVVVEPPDGGVMVR